MAKNLTQTRSYAKAIFDLALSQQAQSKWYAMLNILAQITLACRESAILENPNINESQKIAVFTEVIAEFPAVLNLIKFLIQRKKISLLPAIAASYQQLFFSYTKTLEVKVVSAEELTVLQKEGILNALKKRYQCEILLQYQVDSHLIGGAVVYMEDQVIDGSITGILKRLRQTLLLK